MIFTGIDNGTTGTIGIITPETIEFFRTPKFKTLNYTKKKAWIHRVDSMELYKKLEIFCCLSEKRCAYVERPMVTPSFFKTTTVALRAFEATICVLESLGFLYKVVDAKQWRKKIFPSGYKEKDHKKTSCDIGKRLFPEHKELIKKHGDADGLLIARYCQLMEGQKIVDANEKLVKGLKNAKG